MDMIPAFPHPATRKTIYYTEQPDVNRSARYRIFKRGLDLFVSLLLLLLLLVPMSVIALVIVLDSPGSPIFCQERLGRNGRPFILLKFRSMRRDAEPNGPQWAAVRDSRCTRVGAFLRKYRLDELPQLFNILVGQMSFVGPRPERAYFYSQFETYVIGFSNRLAVTPGLTGLAQINGGYDLLPEEKVAYDMTYIGSASLQTDIKCILRTIPVLLSCSGAR